MSDDHRYLAPREAAELLDVGESTIKRWVDRGVLPAERTAGRHRKIRLADLVRVARLLNLPRANLQRLRLLTAPVELPALAEQFFAVLLAADQARAADLLRSAYEGGLTVEQLGDSVIAPAMTRVGLGWESGELDVYQEHAATLACLSALQGLRPLLPIPPETALLAVGGGPEGDPSLLGNVLVEMTVREAGWATHNIGADTPARSLCRAVRDRRPRLVWLSCSHLPDEQRLLAGMRLLLKEAAAVGATVAVGGRALGPEVRAQMGAVHGCDRLADLAALAHVLRAG